MILLNKGQQRHDKICVMTAFDLTRTEHVFIRFV